MSRPRIFFVAVLAGSLLAGTATSQLRGAAGLPAPRPHPGNVSQPLVGGNNNRPGPACSGARSGGMSVPPPPAVTRGVKLAGDALAAAVKTVAAMPWHKTLKTAVVEAERLERPVLLLQTLGDLDGFA